MYVTILAVCMAMFLKRCHDQLANLIDNQAQREPNPAAVDDVASASPSPDNKPKRNDPDSPRSKQSVGSPRLCAAENVRAVRLFTDSASDANGSGPGDSWPSIPSNEESATANTVEAPEEAPEEEPEEEPDRAGD